MTPVWQIDWRYVSHRVEVGDGSLVVVVNVSIMPPSEERERLFTANLFRATLGGDVIWQVEGQPDIWPASSYIAVERVGADIIAWTGAGRMYSVNEDNGGIKYVGYTR